MDLEEIISEIKKQDLTAYEIAKVLPLSEVGINKIINGQSKNPRKATLQILTAYLLRNKSITNTHQIDFEEPDLGNLSPPGSWIPWRKIKIKESHEVFKTKSGNIIDELSSGKFLLTVPLLPYKAHATYISEFQDAEYIDDLTKVSFMVDKVPRGKYIAFEIQNDSMNDATLEYGPSREAILNGDVVLGRELGKQHWTSKLNTNGYPYWIIIHKDTIVCKQIINHDVTNGIITCHSLNNSPEFQDFNLNLDDCYQLFNIIKKQI